MTIQPLPIKEDRTPYQQFEDGDGVMAYLPRVEQLMDVELPPNSQLRQELAWMLDAIRRLKASLPSRLS